MDSPQSVVSPFKNLTVTDTEKARSDYSDQTQPSNTKPSNSIGVLDVHIHQARDIHNICIYHKQDVYAKICLTSDPENTVSTQTINGGGRNPVFNETLRLDLPTLDASLKCEIWMLSRVRNYLEDQLLGFALVPLSEVVVANGKVEKEFSLSSTDLYHSPSGFVQLSLKYSGSSPEVMVISKGPVSSVEETEQETSEYDRIEFPDPKIANENEIMVNEYFGMNGNSLDSHSAQSQVSSETENQFSSETVQIPEMDSPISVSTNGIRPSSSQSSETHQDEHVSPRKEKAKPNDDFTAENGDGKNEGLNGPETEEVYKPVSFKVEPPEEKMVQQDIVDMYMKSMQQFTESLAKMKLPMDLEKSNNNEAKSETSSSSEATAQTPKTPGSRVFYGSRAFF